MGMHKEHELVEKLVDLFDRNTYDLPENLEEHSSYDGSEILLVQTGKAVLRVTDATDFTYFGKRFKYNIDIETESEYSQYYDNEQDADFQFSTLYPEEEVKIIRFVHVLKQYRGTIKHISFNEDIIEFLKTLQLKKRTLWKRLCLKK